MAHHIATAFLHRILNAAVVCEVLSHMTIDQKNEEFHYTTFQMVFSHESHCYAHTPHATISQTITYTHLTEFIKGSHIIIIKAIGCIKKIILAALRHATSHISINNSHDTKDNFSQLLIIVSQQDCLAKYNEWRDQQL